MEVSFKAKQLEMGQFPESRAHTAEDRNILIKPKQCHSAS